MSDYGSNFDSNFDSNLYNTNEEVPGPPSNLPESPILGGDKGGGSPPHPESVSALGRQIIHISQNDLKEYATEKFDYSSAIKPHMNVREMINLISKVACKVLEMEEERDFGGLDKLYQSLEERLEVVETGKTISMKIEGEAIKLQMDKIDKIFSHLAPRRDDIDPTVMGQSDVQLVPQQKIEKKDLELLDAVLFHKETINNSLLWLLDGDRVMSLNIPCVGQPDNSDKMAQLKASIPQLESSCNALADEEMNLKAKKEEKTSQTEDHTGLLTPSSSIVLPGEKTPLKSANEQDLAAVESDLSKVQNKISYLKKLIELGT